VPDLADDPRFSTNELRVAGAQGDVGRN
jgi:hypothetical protein